MPVNPKFRYDQTVRRYRDRAGRFVNNDKVRSYVDRTAIAFSLVVEQRAKDLLVNFNEENFIKWYRTTRRELKELHQAATIVALGGKESAIQFSNQNGAAWARTELAIGEQLKYFDRFAYGLLNGTIPLDGFVSARSAMYALAGYATYENAVRIREQVAGLTEERAETRSGNPCPDCTDRQLAGWQPIGTLPVIGDSVCRSRCRCKWYFRKVEPEDLVENLNPEEN